MRVGLCVALLAIAILHVIGTRAEAVEAAVRLAKAHTGKTEVLGFWGGFHGKTGGVLPLSGS